MATYTSNYQLHQWVPSDNFLRTDFNTDFQKIDAALAALNSGKASAGTVSSLQSAVSSLQSAMGGKLELRSGSYSGNGSTGRVISVGATPRILFISQNAFVTTLIQDANTSADAVIITNGFRLDDYSINTPGRTYPYLAVL